MTIKVFFVDKIISSFVLCTCVSETNANPNCDKISRYKFKIPSTCAVSSAGALKENFHNSKWSFWFSRAFAWLLSLHIQSRRILRRNSIQSPTRTSGFSQDSTRPSVSWWTFATWARLLRRISCRADQREFWFTDGTGERIDFWLIGDDKMEYSVAQTRTLTLWRRQPSWEAMTWISCKSVC